MTNAGRPAMRPAQGSSPWALALLILAALMWSGHSVIGSDEASDRLAEAKNHRQQKSLRTTENHIGSPSDPTIHSDGTIFRDTFGPEGDRNHNGWPDSWRRRVGPGFPRYVTMNREADVDAPAGHALRVDLNGAAATAYSSPIPVDTAYAYRVTAQVKTAGLRHDQAYLSWRLHDARGVAIGEHRSSSLGGDSPWQTLLIAPPAVDDPRIHSATIGLHVQPGEKADLAGQTWFADVRVVRQSRLLVSITPRGQVALTNEPLQISVRISGLDGTPARLSLKVRDSSGTTAGETARLVAEQQFEVVQVAAQRTQRGEWTWSPPHLGPGYYQLRVELIDGQGRVRGEHDTTLAVVHPVDHTPSADGRREQGCRFGWSFSSTCRADVAELAQRLGMSTVKLPLWLDAKDPTALEAKNRLQDLRIRGVRVVGVLANPPGETRKALFGDAAADAKLAQLLKTPTAKLAAALEAVILPLALQVREWQLGDDADRTLGDDQATLEAVRALETELANRGLSVHFKIPTLLGSSGGLPHVLHFVPGTMTTDKLAATLEQDKDRPRSLTFAAQNNSSPRDFVLRRLAIPQFELSTLLDPFDPAQALFRADGSPGELLLPWSVLTHALDGAQYIGRLRLPGGSENRVFQRGGQAVIVLWRQQPGEETLFAGPSAARVDLWGRRALLASSTGGQLVSLGPMPIFIVDADVGLLRTQLGVSFESPRVPSIPRVPHTLRLRLPNHFGRDVTGKVTLHLPPRWRTDSHAPRPFEIAKDKEAVLSFQVRLPFDGASGSQPVRIEVETVGEMARRFTVHHELFAGDNDVRLSATAKLDAAGQLIVTQRLDFGTSAKSNPAAPAVARRFDCQLMIPGRRTLRVTVQPSGRATHEHVYTIPDGADLIGRPVRLRVDEAGGSRVLGIELLVEDPQSTSTPASSDSP